LADLAAAALIREGPVVDGRVNAWVTVQERAVRAMAGLAFRLRLAPASRFDRVVAGTTSRTGIEWNGVDDDEGLLAWPCELVKRKGAARECGDRTAND
jgi:hypothetical protein